jgi:NitT/TauT family transport system substrate-binding protein
LNSILYVILTTLCLLTPVTCNRDTQQPLRVGANAWPGYEPMFLARSLGYFEGRSIQLVEFSSATEVLRAYRNGLIEVAAVTMDEALLAQDGQPDSRIVLVCDSSNGADALLARPEITCLKDLKGRRVGVESTALGAYMLARALKHGGLVPADVQVVPVPLLEHVTAYTSGKVEAVVTFDPHRSRLLAAGARSLFDSSQIPGEIVDVLLTRTELSAGHNQALGILVTSWFHSLDYLRKNPSDAAARVAPREAVTAPQFLASLQGMQLPDREANLRMLGSSPENLAPRLLQLSNIMCESKVTPGLARPPHLDDAFVRGAVP